MDVTDRRTALRMIPYGLYVVTARDGQGGIAAATVNWLTQVSFEPPLLALALKSGSGLASAVSETRALGINVLGKSDGELATTFFRPTTYDEERVSGERYRIGETGVPLLQTVAATIECRVRSTVAEGDHDLCVAEAVGVQVLKPPPGRPDEATLWLRDLGESVFYGG